MSDSMGQIAAEYLPDISRAMADDKHGNTNVLFPIAGAAANLSHTSVTRFLFLVGQDPDGYANVETGQKSYMANLMDYHLNPDTPADQQYPHPPKDTITAISHRLGEIAGTLGGGRQEAVLGPAKEADSDFDDAVAQKKNTWSGAIGTGVGVEVSSIATPVGGAVAGGVAGTVSSVVLEHLFQKSEAENLNNADQNAASRREDSKDKNGTRSQEAAKAAVKAHNSPNASGAADWALTGTAAGFTEASASLSQMAKPEPK
ncbi:hypothetical protein ABCR94_38810 [Streptomyces sp. 21So2-11]|uniref:hypothetical protein n=1 Tax=Streptomyces sp. 21So2-11 TaxID=3144408 RepID=UPI003219C943